MELMISVKLRLVKPGTGLRDLADARLAIDKSNKLKWKSYLL